METILNEDNLQIEQIHEFMTKVRAILIDENNKILIANYGNIILLPGGKVDNNESIYKAIIRELGEELGENYNNEELDFFITLNHYQKNYPKRNGTFKNRLVQTHYFIGSYKGFKKSSQNLSEKERKDNFKLELISLEDLEKMILNNKNDNPRNIYFQKELLTILTNYKNSKQKKIVKKIEFKPL